MKEINLREFYPEIYKTDLFISLPDEVVDVLVEYQRKEVAYRRRTYRHKAFLSLDYGDDIEREAVLFTPTLQEIVERHLEEERVYDAVKLAAACGIPGPEKGLPGGVANTASY